MTPTRDTNGIRYHESVSDVRKLSTQMSDCLNACTVSAEQPVGAELVCGEVDRHV